MATFNDLPLPLAEPGALFHLDRPTRLHWNETTSDGSTVSIFAGARQVIVSGIDPNISIDDLGEATRDSANAALDVMAARSVAARTLLSHAEPYLVWKPTPVGPLLRVATEVESHFNATVGGGPADTAAIWHESMRYFRLSQTTPDLFDAFRNLYLALESLLSELESPCGQPANPAPMVNGCEMLS